MKRILFRSINERMNSKKYQQQYNINEITKSQLINFRQFGPILSNRIIANKPFKSFDDVNQIRGIGIVRISILKNKTYLR